MAVTSQYRLWALSKHNRKPLTVSMISSRIHLCFYWSGCGRSVADLKGEGEPEARINQSHTRIIKLGRTLRCVQENQENDWTKCFIYYASPPSYQYGSRCANEQVLTKVSVWPEHVHSGGPGLINGGGQPCSETPRNMTVGKMQILNEEVKVQEILRIALRTLIYKW